MGNRIQLDPDDATPMSVYMQLVCLNASMYPKGDCIPCGATIRMGFFFDAFGRNRDIDDKFSSQYSNICRLWEAHRSNDDNRKPANQFWFRFYYSGLGTPLNEDAKSNAWINAGWAALGMGGKKAGKTATSVAESFSRTKAPIKQVKVEDRIKDAVKESAADFSFKPLLKAFEDLRKDIENVPSTARRVTNVLNASPERLWERTKAAGRVLWRSTKNEVKTNFKGNPIKTSIAIARDLFVGIAVENVPIVRDSGVMAEYFGAGVDTRLKAAKDQFEAAFKEVKKQMPKVRVVEVSVFGAERGCVLARAFVNDLAEKYKRRDDTDLAIDGVPVRIKFLGLFDAVSSIMSEETGELIGMMPYLGAIKPNYKDQNLAVPASVERCVHFAAAHEMRFYQRLDSLEKTRGEQFLYPGTSCDVVGGAPNGSLGVHAELMRIPLRDMLLEALKAGASIDTMEDLLDKKPDTFRKFTIAQSISANGKQYRIRKLVDAYYALVPRKPGVDFLEHSKVFLQWMASRYRDPGSRNSIANPVTDWHQKFADADEQRKAATAKLDWELQRQGIDMSMLSSRSPADQATLLKLKAASDAAQNRYDGVISAAPKREYTSVWTRLQSESDEMLRRASYQDGLHRSVDLLKKSSDTWDSDNQLSAEAVESSMLSADQMALVQAWKEGIGGKNPLPPDVIALFDMLVHDTLLTSWQDHVLAPSLYFRTRDKDVFGSTNFAKEDKRRKQDDVAAARVDQLARQSQQWSNTYKGTPPIH
ncbi:phospholipase effector Tle1 domain-containing protein [Paraburkholderia phenoliruptrix]|uniref:phospholipase effector Tle1 domain-containing protein n=1 Tax=Paraburkholderia phenoliruptrix TaxID=252970 RepID=UPI003D96A310